jgi:hypothetical protein
VISRLIVFSSLGAPNDVLKYFWPVVSESNIRVRTLPSPRIDDTVEDYKLPEQNRHWRSSFTPAEGCPKSQLSSVWLSHIINCCARPEFASEVVGTKQEVERTAGMIRELCRKYRKNVPKEDPTQGKSVESRKQLPCGLRLAGNVRARRGSVEPYGNFTNKTTSSRTAR